MKMYKDFFRKINNTLEQNGFHFAKYVGMFAIILFGFHFLYSAVVNEDLMISGLEPLYLYLRVLLFQHSTWVIEHILGYNISRQGFNIVFESGGMIIIDESCSAVKWFAHFLILMLLFPGPWKHKAWFIPLGLLITHLVNIIRISGLAIVFVNRLPSFDFYHDFVFRPLFYLVLFLMWVAWVEFFFLPSKPNKHS